MPRIVDNIESSRLPVRRRYRSAAVLLLWASASTGHAIEGVPHLQGRIAVDVSTGILSGDTCISGLANRPGHSFLLHRGLNIRDVRDHPTRAPGHLLPYERDINVVDAMRYTISGDQTLKGFCIRYVGAYPVYRLENGEHSVSDWKGQIAFDGHSVRAAEQTRFYPVVEDSVTGAAFENLTYELEVSCATCRTLYVNGAPPVPGPRARFESKVPRPLLLYAGNFPAHAADRTYFIGMDVTAADAHTIDQGLTIIARAHESYLGIPFGDRPALVSFAATSEDKKPGQIHWAFVTWPTIAIDGKLPFSTLLRTENGRTELTPDVVAWMTHEMAHYYFGTLYDPQGPLTWFLLESTAEFLSLKAVRSLFGENVYESKLRTYYESAVRADPVIALSKISDAEEIGEHYRYRLGPLLLVALESYIGEDNLRRALKALVTKPPQGAVDFARLREVLLAHGANGTSLDAFEQECLHPLISEGCLSQVNARDRD